MKYTIVGLFLIIACAGLAWKLSPTQSSTTSTGAETLKNNIATIQEIPVPAGYQRVKVSPTSFGHYLRNLPLKSDPTVYLYNGQKKRNQRAQYAVVDIDVGKKNLQQCADAIMRLRAEYLFAQKQFHQIRFNFTSGDPALYTQWRKGYRARIRGNKVSWLKSRSYDPSYQNFRKYLEVVFTYAGSYSLARELKKVQNIRDLRLGDVFIQGGFPGHAVLVVDVARHSRTGEVVFLLAQSYMPAQDIHLLKNLNNSRLNPWYSIRQVREELETPEWTFKKNNLKRF
ncbi:MAG TPA: hypothetical protein DCS93_40900 [Microscillaceae bacterium]|nr:hypothetical protein [Microscillaceae bacterium]